jgi:uncharacterized NAD(P)/FAD-binding protein YdhS
MSTAVNRVVIVGGGFSGTVVAARLLAGCQGPTSVTILEAREALGLGVAYSTTDHRHLLNVPAAEMSALPERPTDFLDWLRSTGNSADESAFVPRSLYGPYLRDLLNRAVFAAPRGSRLTWCHERAASLRPDRVDSGGLVIGLEAGGQLRAQHAVLAVGAAPPLLPEPLASDLAGFPGYVADPWAPGALDRVGRDGGDVLFIGTGLTMVDAVLTVASSDRRPGVLHARSRHGMRPNVHLPWRGRRLLTLAVEPGQSAHRLLRDIRLAVASAVAEGVPWQDAVDSVRWLAPSLWEALPEEQRRKVLRHAYRAWQVAAHRTAPSVGAELQHLSSSGALTIGRGRLISARSAGESAELELLAANNTEVLRATSVVNCTGPSGDVARIPLVGAGMDCGLFRPDLAGFGIDIDAAGHPIGADGTPASHISVIGWLCRGRLFESTAVRDLRVQAKALADQLGSRHSVPPVERDGGTTLHPSVVATALPA